MSEIVRSKAHVLIIDDEPEIRNVLHEFLSGSYQCAAVNSAEEALALIATERFDLIISDITMERMSGLEMVPHVLNVAPQTIIVMISGQQTIEYAIEAMRAGAFDYITKPFDLGHVDAAVCRALEHHKLLEAKQLYEKSLKELVKQRAAEVEHLASHDTLTDLPNRALFEDRVAQALAVAQRTRQMHGTLFLALDGFKKIVDTLGHAAGDLLLKVVAGRLKQCVNESDTVARFDGNEIYREGSIEDISERKRAEEALRESEERYRDLIENAHDIIYSHDLNGRYTSMNEAGAQITGYTREEVLALDLTQTVAPEHIEKVREMLRKMLAGEEVSANEMEIIAKDGHRVTVEANTKLVFHNGVPVGVQGIARDVTARKLLEEQLRQSQKMEAIGQLAGGVAHDFNNLLTAINGYSGLALQRIDDNHPLKGYLEEIKKAGDRAANLTRQLLAFGRKQILQPLPINLNDVVTDMNKMLRRLIGEDIVLTAKLDPALKRIKADPGQIEQVLVNLIVNARNAMPQGGKLTIETVGVDLDQEYAGRHVGVVPGGYVMLAVSDTGTGMDEDTRARIFDPFFTTKEKGKGTGLGLSTVYGIVKQSGGNIWVYSELGHGTTFKVYLPELTAGSQKTEAAAVELPMPSGSETILLVEDEDVVRGLARKILEHAGYNVLEASRGKEAIRLCLERVEPIDLLLTDVVMPETSGKEVADRLTELLPGLRVLFMSGYTDEAIVHHGVLDSNVKFIQKPFSPAALTRKVREVLDSNGKVSMV